MLGVELFAKLAQLRDPVLSQEMLKRLNGAQLSPAAKAAALQSPLMRAAVATLERTCEADVMWSSGGAGGRWARELRGDPPSAAPEGGRDGAISAPPVLNSTAEIQRRYLEQKAVADMTAHGAEYSTLPPVDVASETSPRMAPEPRARARRAGRQGDVSLPPIEEGASAGRLDGQHTGSVDRLPAELQERATAASAQVADLKRRLERSVEELERRAAAEQTTARGVAREADPWRGISEERVRKLQQLLRGATARERKAQEALALAEDQQRRDAEEVAAVEAAQELEAAIEDEVAQPSRAKRQSKRQQRQGAVSAPPDERRRAKRSPRAERPERQQPEKLAAVVVPPKQKYRAPVDDEDRQVRAEATKAKEGEAMEHDIHSLNAKLQDELQVLAAESSGDGESLSFAGVHQLLRQSGVYGERFSKADASSLFFEVLRSHGPGRPMMHADGPRGKGTNRMQQMSDGRLQLAEVPRLLRRVAARLFVSDTLQDEWGNKIPAHRSEEEAYHFLLAQHICAPNVEHADDGGSGLYLATGRSPRRSPRSKSRSPNRSPRATPAPNRRAKKPPVVTADSESDEEAAESSEDGDEFELDDDEYDENEQPAEYQDSDEEEDDGEDSAGEGVRKQRTAKKQRAWVASQLKEIFVAYASFGDAMNMTELSLPKFIKLLKDCQVIDNKSVRRGDVDLAFTSIVGKSKRKSITHAEFEDALRLIANKKFGVKRSAAALKNAGPALEAYDSFITDYILEHGRVLGADLAPPSAKGLKSAPVQSLIASNERALRQVFLAYAHDPTLHRPILSLQNFCVLCLQLGISPPVPKPDLARCFRAVNIGVAADGNEGEMDFEEYVECLYRLSRHPSVDSVTAGTLPQEKFAVLLETVAGSPALRKLETKLGKVRTLTLS